jgi:hypothetical protein
MENQELSKIAKNQLSIFGSWFFCTQNREINQVNEYLAKKEKRPEINAPAG